MRRLSVRAAQEFHYRLPRRVRGYRPGSHPGSSMGAGQEFIAHVSLYDRPDPRRLDLRASLRNLGSDWLVRVHRQRAGVSVYAVVDVSASMAFGAVQAKRRIVTDFLDSLGLSAFRAGDAVGMLAFDGRERADLFVPARVSRDAGRFLSDVLRRGVANYEVDGERDARSAASAPGAPGYVSVSRAHGAVIAPGAPGVPGKINAPKAPGAADGFRAPRADGAAADGSSGLEQAVTRIAGREGLVFIASDFHWPLARLGAALDLLSPAFVVPLVIWDRAETEPPARNGLALLRDVESGAQRTVWVRPRTRSRWLAAVAARRAELDHIFASRDVRPIYLQGEFDAQVLSRHFLEGGT